MGRLWFPFPQTDRQKSGLRVIVLLSAGVDRCQKVTQTRIQWSGANQLCGVWTIICPYISCTVDVRYIAKPQLKSSLSLTLCSVSMCVCFYYYLYVTLQIWLNCPWSVFYDTFPSHQWILVLACKSYLGMSNTVATQESCRDQIASWQADSVVVKAHLLVGSHHSKPP